MKHVPKKLFIFTVGCLFALLVIELVLRLSGAIMIGRRTKRSEGKVRTDKTYTILCLGNCYTFGTGAPKGQSYPDHLKSLIDKKIPDNDIRIYNHGVPGLNSGKLLDRFEEHIDVVDPDLIILRTGSPNMRDHRNFGEYQRRISQAKGVSDDSSGLKTQELLPETLLNKLKLYRLFKYMYEDFNNVRKFRKSSVTDEIKMLDKLVNVEERTTGWDQDDISFWSAEQENRDLVKSLGSEEAADFLKKADLALKNKDFTLATQLFIKALLTANIEDVRLQNRLFSRLKNTAVMADFDKIHPMITEFKDTHPEIADNLRTVASSDVFKWVRSDLEEMIRIIKAKDIDILLLTYPVLFPPDFTDAQKRMNLYRTETLSLDLDQKRKKRAMDQQKAYAAAGGSGFRNFILQVNGILRSVAKSEDLLLVDIEKDFRELLLLGEYEHVSVGRHPDGKGYYQMAREIYPFTAKLFKENIE